MSSYSLRRGFRGVTRSHSPTPSSANFIRPGKRPLSSISPTIIEDYKTGKASHSVASAGGSRIITANIQTNFQALRGVDLQEAIVSASIKGKATAFIHIS